MMIYINMFQITNFTYHKLLSLSPATRYHQYKYCDVSMEISSLMINQNYTDNAARKQEQKFVFMIVIDAVLQVSTPIDLVNYFSE